MFALKGRPNIRSARGRIVSNIDSSALSGRVLYMTNLGLKPQAEYFGPFGTLIEIRDGTMSLVSRWDSACLKELLQDLDSFLHSEWSRESELLQESPLSPVSPLFQVLANSTERLLHSAWLRASLNSLDLEKELLAQARP